MNDWKDVPHFGAPSKRESFRIRVERNGSPTAPFIDFTNGRLDSTTPGAKVGAENGDASTGCRYYYNGTGTPPAIGVDLLVKTLVGGTATLGSQVETDCSVNAVSRAGLSNSAGDKAAIAVTACE